MSGEALAWAGDHTPKGRAKELLKILGAYADADGVTWAAVGTIAEDMQLTDRQVQRLLRVLLDGEYLKPTGRFHHRGIPYYQLALAWIGPLAAVRAARKAARLNPPKGDMDVTLCNSRGDMDVTPRGDMDVTRTKLELREEANASSDAGARSDVDVDFEAVFAAWQDRDPGRLSRPLARRPWAEACKRVSADRLAAAAMRYLAEDADARRLGVTSLHKWLEQDRWEAWLGPAPVASLAPDADAAAAWAGPAEIVEAVVAAGGSAFAASYLAPARHDGPGRTLWTRTGMAADRLRAALSAADWARLGVDRITREV